MPATRTSLLAQSLSATVSRSIARHTLPSGGMLAALNATGWHNYSLFLRDDGLLIGYFETEDLEASLAGMAATEVNSRWQAAMAENFDDLDVPADQGFVRLAEVFHL